MKQPIFAIILMLASSSAAALDVFSCEPEWAALVTELAGERANITVATTAFQDPHSLQARPSLLAAIRRADLLVCTGADLEIGWLPLLLRRAGGAAIQRGNPGHFLAADYVRMLEVPAQIDRSQGDIHPQGNPHIHLNPRNIVPIADQMTRRLIELDPVAKTEYQTRLTKFRTRWTDAVSGWEDRGSKLAGLRLASHHRSFSYLADWLGLNIVATLEPKPGIPPSGKHLAGLLERLSPQPPVAIIRTPYANEKPSAWLSGRLGASALVLPYTVGGTDAAMDLFGLFDVTLAALESVNP
ncbi:MAG: metal ABC transporter substrate-binding protein [Gammaproteobacteria bacterium]